MFRTRVKICGITNMDDAQQAVDLGVDALGFNLFAGSPRYIEPERAIEIASTLPVFVTSVALLVNHAAAEIQKIDGHFDLLQFHGDEPDEFCCSFRTPFIKVINVKDFDGLAGQVGQFPNSQGILLDAFVEGKRGGTGKTIDWQKLGSVSKSVVLAGGLNSHNVKEAIRQVNPYAVDVSSGVEKLKGVKDVEKMNDFFRAVREADDE